MDKIFKTEGAKGIVKGLAIGVFFTVVISLLVFTSDQKIDTEIVKNSNTNQIVNTNPSQPTSPPPPPSTGDFSKISKVSDDDYIRGNLDAEITLIEYSDFQCPFCQRHLPTINQLLDEYGDKIRFVYRHFPLTSIHPYAQIAAEASECAGEQGKFWEMHDTMFDNQAALDAISLKSYAKQIGLNQVQFDNCLDDGKYKDKVSQQAVEAQAAGITGTPGTFVNEQLVKGAYPVTTFEQIIDGLLSN